jgi:formylglycine-generating enzyme required for sulfatase activity
LPRSSVVARSALFALAAGVLLPLPEASARKPPCPGGMANIRGRYCIDAYEAYLDIVDARGKVLRRQSPYRTPDAEERVVAKTRRGRVPQAYISQKQAAEACKLAGKRLCSDDEWMTACKGKTPTLYPYGEDHVDRRCNDHGVSPLRVLHGKDDGLETFGIDAMNDPKLNQIAGTVAKSGQFSRCRSSFGVYDMVGNLHEWTADPGGTFRGGYYLDNETNGRGCDYVTKAHDTKYHDYSIGFRCCRDAGGR